MNFYFRKYYRYFFHMKKSQAQKFVAQWKKNQMK